MAPSLIEPAAGTSAQDRTAGRPASVVPPPATAVAAPPRESPPARRPIAHDRRARSSASRTCACTTANRRPCSASRWTFPRQQVTALIGPSGCGKSTLLRCLNRMNDLIDNVRTTGQDPVGRAGHSGSRPGRDRACAAAWAWCFSGPRRFPSRSTRTWPTACGSPAFPNGRFSTKRWKGASAGPPSGTRSRTGCTSRPWGSPAASTSGCASPGRSRSTRRSSSWTSRARPWTRVPPRASRN